MGLKILKSYRVIVMLFVSMTILAIYISWPNNDKELRALQVTHDIEKPIQDGSNTPSRLILKNKNIIPRLSLEGLLMFDNGIRRVLIKVNDASAKWYYDGDEIEDGLFVFKVKNKGVILKKDDAYYNLALVSQLSIIKE